MRLLTTAKGLCGAAALAAALGGAACREAAVTNVNENTGTAGTTNINSNANANLTTSTITTASGATIEAKEPDKYTANVVVTATTSGQQRAAGSTTVRVARNGTDRRYSVDTRLPGVGELIFLDKADKRYLILPARKQYAELTPEMTGFDVGRSLTPGQLVAYIQRQQGVERVGDETLNGRPAVKYRVAGRAQTQTQAGQVAGESFIYVDKETGLPLRIEGFGQSTGNVQGVSGGNLVAEMRDIRTEANPADFELPQGFAKVTPEEVRQMTAQLTQAIQVLMQFLNQQQGGAGAAATPAAGASPAASPR
ncbi:MAG TPA: hypothetical protein VG148_01100 [Pyrinomonadaceae bacterium]|nr:hypothetical protein [Pyrinomonadaceae bacterium]